jgi:hypothetical protein
MFRFLAITAVACGSMCVSLTSPALAQEARRSAYFASVAASPPVSPYVNLGVNPNGLSNYQTHVRPLLNEREAAAQQMANARRLRHQPRQPSDGRAASDPQARPANERDVARRFLNYSHYFGAPR